MRAEPSALADARRWPSGLKLTPKMAPLCPVRRCNSLPLPAVPERHGCVHAAGSDDLRVGTDGHAAGLGRTREFAPLIPRGEFQHAHLAVPTARGQPLAIPAESDALYFPMVRGEGSNFHARHRVEQFDFAGEDSGFGEVLTHGHPFAVSAEGHASNPLGMAGERYGLEEVARDRIPHAHGAVIFHRRQRGRVAAKRQPANRLAGGFQSSVQNEMHHRSPCGASGSRWRLGLWLVLCRQDQKHRTEEDERKNCDPNQPRIRCPSPIIESVRIQMLCCILQPGGEKAWTVAEGVERVTAGSGNPRGGRKTVTTVQIRGKTSCSMRLRRLLS